MADNASGEASEYNTEIINEFRVNQGRIGGMAAPVIPCRAAPGPATPFAW